MRPKGAGEGATEGGNGTNAGQYQHCIRYRLPQGSCSAAEGRSCLSIGTPESIMLEGEVGTLPFLVWPTPACKKLSENPP